MEHLRISAHIAQLNAAERARSARQNMAVNPPRALYLQSISAAYYRQARVALGIES